MESTGRVQSVESVESAGPLGRWSGSGYRVVMSVSVVREEHVISLVWLLVLVLTVELLHPMLNHFGSAKPCFDLSACPSRQ